MTHTGNGINGSLTIAAVAGETNNLTLSRTNLGDNNNGVWTITETGTGVTTATETGACTITDAAPVPVVMTCPDNALSNAFTSVAVTLGNQNDTFSASAAGTDPISIAGGDGSDTMVGSQDVDTFTGGADAGMDRMTGGPAADVFDGGPGIDRVMYTTSTAATNITFDNTANDTDGLGATTENVQNSVESLTGSPQTDTVVGSCGTGTNPNGSSFSNTFAGQGGNDNLSDPITAGCNSPDFFGGGAGNDVINGRGGTDTVTYTTNTAAQPISVTLNGVANDSDGLGGTDNIAADIEVVYGGAGADTINATGAAAGVSLWGRAGNDTLTGSAFNDIVRGEVGPGDILNCLGGANDMYTVNPDGNASVTNCETVIPG